MKVKPFVSFVIVSAISFGIGCDSNSIDSVPAADQLCDDCVPLPASPPVITSVYPPVFYGGAEVKISGSYLAQATVVVNGALVTPSYQGAHEVRFLAPDLPAGSYQLDIENAVGDVLREVSYQSVLSASTVSSGTTHTCVLNTVGGVQCWGFNDYGQLGDGSTTEASTPVTVTGLSDAVAVSAGGSHTCAMTSTGRVQCWGHNAFGELGDGSKTNSSIPVTVSGISDAVAVSAGGGRTCSVTSSGSVKCWGTRDQLGDGSLDAVSTPVTVSGLSDVVSISAGAEHTCAVTGRGSVECWGSNNWGQLGNGSYAHALTPVTVSGLIDAVAVSAGGGHTCAMTSTGRVQCWGKNFGGELDDVGNWTNALTPVMVSGLDEVVFISAGENHTCAVISNGRIECWGEGFSGQLGGGSTTETLTPVTVSGLSDAVAVSAGGSHTCALTRTGQVHCWGRTPPASSTLAVKHMH